jgi:2-polyprenyl-6-methoxyphenol hydroxylase-like FAD-dependent oxidoreductase
MAFDCDVLVVGGGPVGLLVAYELVERGVSVILIERNLDTTRHPKMDITNGRSLELMRRFGLSERLRDAAVPRDHPMDVVWLSRFAEWELARFAYRTTVERQADIRARNDGSQPLEPDMRMSQVVLEPLLRDMLLATGKCDVRYGVEFVGLQQDEQDVTATVRDTRTGEIQSIRSQYLAGCDGGASKVRGELGIVCAGAWSVAQLYMVHFEVEDADVLRRHGIAWHYQSPVGGTLIAQDDDRIFTLHVPLRPDEDVAAINPRDLLYSALGCEFACTIIESNAWTPHLVVADRYGEGRVWLAGDAVHQYIPTGGYGMNTGVGDAADLAWKFAAMVQGWGGPDLLPSIEDERRPVGQANCQAAGENAGVRFQIAAAYSPEVHLDSDLGAAAREKLGALILELGNAENESRGIEFGYRYRQSPIIVRDVDDTEPEWRLLEYVPSTWPGSRPPHLFLEDGSALFDQFGPGFTLIASAGADCTAMREAAAGAGLPLTILPLSEPAVCDLYERNYVLIRPDQIVAWRGNALPKDCHSLLNLVSGNGKGLRK